ncbi:MAG: two component transcriptional regulator, winged helix family [Bryobacterales bacterium]|nr:two component transcriptional regulator, winged helix family [Bryobacterales bacterium]
MNESILIIEDDLEMAQVLQQGLEQETYRVSLAHNGGKGLEMARSGPFEAIVLDVMLPALDGYSLARQLRAEGNSTPILMLTALDGTADIVTGLDAGAEDYLTKPFSFIELLARLRAVLRRGRPQPVTFRVADLTMDTASHAVTRDGQSISLTKTEYLLLGVLMRNAGHVVSRGEIVKAVWESRTGIEQNSIDAYVKTLRAKVDENYREKLIHTVRGFGYKLAPASDSL